MSKNNVFALPQPGTFTDLLTEVLRNEAHALLAQAVETEAAVFLETYADLQGDGCGDRGTQVIKSRGTSVSLAEMNASRAHRWTS